MKRSFIWAGSILLLMCVTGCDLDPVLYDDNGDPLTISETEKGDAGEAEEEDAGLNTADAP